MLNKKLNAFYSHEFEKAANLVKTDTEYGIRRIGETVLADLNNVRDTLLKLYQTVVLNRQNISDDQLQDLEEISSKLIVLNLDQQVSSQLNRWDRGKNPRMLKQNKEKAGLVQLTLFDPMAHLTLDEDLRVNMAEAERPQALRALNWAETEYDRQIENLQQAKQEYCGHLRQRVNLWVPQFQTMLDLESRVFGWKPASPNSNQESNQEDDGSSNGH
jgi:hypothetical protein